MQDFMLDLETMGNTADAAIVAIGAIAFDPEAGELGPKFYATVDLESAVCNGGKIDASTVLWWLRQDEAARAELAQPGARIVDALKDFREYMGSVQPDPERRKLWGNGSEFDNTILAGAYARSGLKLPWKFWNNRCYRTLKNLHPDIPFQRIGIGHHALDDAHSQAMHAIEIFRARRGLKSA